MKKNGRSKAPGWKGGGVRGAYRNLVGESERRRPVGSS